MISKDNPELAAMQEKQLELLHELDRVCKLTNTKYFLSSGTCLGAVRHQGFIPWDDDVDVYMFWKHAERLAEHQHLFKKQFFVQCKKTDPDIKTTHYRLRDSSTSCFLEEDQGLDVNHGVFIDIYILYPYPDNALYGRCLSLESFVYRVLQAGQGPQNHGGVVKTLGSVVNRVVKGDQRKRIVRRIENRYKHNGGRQYLATYFGRDVTLTNTIVYPRKWFTHPKKLMFEDLLVNVPGDPEAYCKLQYGESFMELPPEEKRVPHHEAIFISTTEPYTNYKGIYY